MTRLAALKDESGTTMTEVLVATFTGLIVLTGLTTVIVVTLHGSARVSARVDATQRARIALTRIMEQLHSACVAPKIAPIKSGSTGTSLEFVHAEGAEGTAVAPDPTLTRISLSNGILTETDWAATGGSAASGWTWSSSPTTRQLVTDVGPVPPATAIFFYFESSNGSTTATPLSANPLGSVNAPKTIQVQVAMEVEPSTTPVKDAGAAASVQDEATLRLTPPSFNENAEALPCQ